MLESRITECKDCKLTMGEVWGGRDMGEVDSTLIGVSVSAFTGVSNAATAEVEEVKLFKSCWFVIMGDGFWASTVDFSFCCCWTGCCWLVRLFLTEDKVFLLFVPREDLSLLSRNEPAPTVQHNNKDKNPPFWNGLLLLGDALVVLLALLSLAVVAVEDWTTVDGKGDLTYSGSTTFLPFSVKIRVNILL